ncbi:MAG: hypothetical protein JWQ87_1488 [Candidatus Sulfotelmatobacter sp.]|nr:hypothetical protein [Candidatus Sulfotelmatobacter sp.]
MADPMPVRFEFLNRMVSAMLRRPHDLQAHSRMVGHPPLVVAQRHVHKHVS